MGHYVLHIEGNGPHDTGSQDDADLMLHQLVHELAEAGHTVFAASVTTGTTRDLIKHHDGELHYEHRPD
jgi:hypothetical protein